MIFNKELFLGYLLLSTSIILGLLYSFYKNYDLVSSLDIFNYLKGYNYLANNNFDFYDFDYFGRYPEFIFLYFISFIALLGPIYNVNSFVLIISSFIYFFLSYAYLNIHKVYNFRLQTTRGLQLQLLAAFLPLGITTQVIRQTFAFSLFLSVIVLSRKLKILLFLLPSFSLFFTHVGSSMLIFLEFLTKKKKLIYLLIFIFLVVLAMQFTRQYLTAQSDIETSSILTFNPEFLTRIDKYALVSIISLTLIRGYKFFLSRRFLIFLFLSFVYLYGGMKYSLVSRIFFGMGWFWLVIIGLSVIGEKRIFLSKSIINIVSLLMMSAKIFSFLILIS